MQPRKRRRSLGSRLEPYLMISPTVLLILGLMVVPIVIVIGYSLMDNTITNPSPKFVGLANYLTVLGSPAFWGAAANTLLFTVVSVVARMMPSASLLVALMTYALQLLVLAICVAAIERAGVGAEDLSRGWFATAVIVVTLLWVVGQLVAATRQRIPVYDLGQEAAPQPARGATDSDDLVEHPGGER